MFTLEDTVRNYIPDDKGINLVIGILGAGPCQKRSMFEQGPRRNTQWRQFRQGWQTEAGRAAAITGSMYQTQQAGCCVLSRENGLDWKMKLNKPNCQ